MMKKAIFETKERAELRSETLNTKSRPAEFCPLINSTCKKDCTCFVSAYVTEHQNGNWIVRGFYCGNAMFDGNRQCSGI